ncbi:MAG: VWA domain-containing protein [Chlorobiaceae bacterium]|nr:VWA domain-containing protein [Chlorobiaceae bacterium]NTV61212.1 VWA domain-containing protein [Chlorobiaceae bacterium]
MQELFPLIPRIEFGEPSWFLLLPLMGAAFLYLRWREKRGRYPVMQFPGLEKLRDAGFGASRVVKTLPRWLRWGSLVLFVVALSGPRIMVRQTEAEAKGIDVILAFDVSESMLQKDFAGESRLDAAKKVARSFVMRRTNDRIGLVVFRGKGYTQCPLTLDHDVLAMLVDRLSPDLIQDDGTAIGTAILISLNRLKASESRHKVIILLTDGENNAGEIWPSTAAGLAVRDGIRIYAVNTALAIAGEHAGPTGQGESHKALDDETLRAIARMTGGGYYRVEDPSAMQKTVEAIDKLEKKRLSGHIEEHRSGLFFQIVFLSLVLLLLDVLLSNTRLLRIP